MILGLLPAGVVGAETLGDDRDAPLWPGEEPLVARAVDKRRREFAAGRDCARRALSQLGRPRGAILAGPGREPLWPPGIIGSITHCEGYCAAIAAPRGDMRSVGIDAERNVPLPRELRARVCTPDEFAAAPHVPGVDAAKLLFSAKEAAFKAWYPLTNVMLDFLQATLELDVDRREFTTRMSASATNGIAPPDVVFHGRWTTSRDHVFTLVTARAL